MPSPAIHFFDLLRAKIAFNLKAEASRNQLSYAWWLLEPLLEATVFYVVFGIFLARGTPNFVAFLLTGLIPFTWFSRSISNSMGSLRGAKWALNNFRINPVFFPLVEIGQDAVKQLVTFTFLVGFLLFYGIEAKLTWLLLPVLMVFQALFVAAASCFVASIIPLLEDLRYLVNTLVLATMFASGIFYDAQVLVTPEWSDVYYLNPVASLLQMYRNCLLYGELPALYNMGMVAFWTVLLALLASWSIGRYRNHYARMLLE